MKILQRVAVGQRFEVSLPAGTYFVGDPCYVLDEGTYDDLCALRWEASPAAGTDIEYNVLLDVHGRGLMLCWSTRVGDGLFGFASRLAGTKSPALGLAVDSGQLAFVDKRIVDRLEDLPKELTEVCGEIALLKPTDLTVDEHGNVAAEDGLLEVVVRGDEDDACSGPTAV